MNGKQFRGYRKVKDGYKVINGGDKVYTEAEVEWRLEHRRLERVFLRALRSHGRALGRSDATEDAFIAARAALADHLAAGGHGTAAHFVRKTDRK